jgi:hypothetical protein
MRSLLAVDLGLKTGLALYRQDGRLQWYRSQNFGKTGRLRRGVRRLLDELPQLAWLMLEGGGPLAVIWEREAARHQIVVWKISAEDWRRQLLHPREQQTGRLAKRSAADGARRVIEWSGAPRPTSLRHDAAEAILIGLWGVLQIGWLERLPDQMRR